MPSVTKAAMLGLLTAAQAFEVFIHGDTNRDGIIDLVGNSDLDGRGIWEEDRGALFLPVVTDTRDRCSSVLPEEPASEPGVAPEENDKCHDSSDNSLRNSNNLASVLTRPIPQGSDDMTGTVAFTSDAFYNNARLWYKNELNRWVYLTKDHIFGAEELRDGLKLGIDGRDIRRPYPMWDGLVSIRFEVEDGKEKGHDIVELRVAPVLTHHVMQTPRQMYVATGKDFQTDQAQFVENVEINSNKFIGLGSLYKFPADEDPWTQDSFEPAYASIPGANGAQKSIRIMIKTARKDRKLAQRVFRNLRSDTVGAVQHKKSCNANIESLGNLETIPPYTFNNKYYPAGRVIMGKNGNSRPVMMDLIDAQEAQAPLEMQTGWLATGHVDEFLQFLPCKKCTHGWALVTANAIAGYELLKAQSDKFGSAKAFSRDPQGYDIYKAVYDPTIDEVLALKDLEAIAVWSQSQIDENIAYIKKETGITEDDIIRVPDLFYLRLSDKQKPIIRPELLKTDISRARVEGSEPCAESKQPDSPRIRDSQKNWKVTSFFPAAINGVVFANGQYLAPTTWGPFLDRKHIFEEEITLAYAKAGYKVTFMDDFFDHHAWGGEVHCGTNMARDMTPWSQPAPNNNVAKTFRA